jgi:hypothetical protein
MSPQTSGQVREESIGPLRGQLAVERSSFLSRCQGLLPLAQSREHAAQVVEAHRQVREEGLGLLRGQLAVERDSFLSRCQGLLPPAQVGEHAAQVKVKKFLEQEFHQLKIVIIMKLIKNICSLF